MPIEDKLTNAERVRLEALNQAVVSSGMGENAEEVLKRAKHFEAWIKDGHLPDDKAKTRTTTRSRMHA